MGPSAKIALVKDSIIMNKIEKTNYINSLKKDLDANNAMMVYHYEGLNVNQLDELREKMREVGALLKVTKNRITNLPSKKQLTPMQKSYLLGLRLLLYLKIQ